MGGRHGRTQRASSRSTHRRARSRHAAVEADAPARSQRPDVPLHVLAHGLDAAPPRWAGRAWPASVEVRHLGRAAAAASGVGREQQEQVVLVLAHPSADGGQLDRAGQAPSRWARACMMHMIPHLSVPSTSHQRTTSGSTAAPGVAVGVEQLVVAAHAGHRRRRRRSARPARTASPGPPWGRRGGRAPSRARPPARRRRPAGSRAGSHRAPRSRRCGGGRWASSQRNASSKAGTGSPNASSTSRY